MNEKTLNARQNASANARIFKPLAILCIVFGHFYGMSGQHVALLDYWWNLSAIALTYFTICSAYFTQIKYRQTFSATEFWKNKARRLGAKLALVNGFLLILFLLQGKENIWGFHSLVNVLGMTGLLNWFGIRNASPFGAGLWFLTLLFLFYGAYPWLRWLYSVYPRARLTLFSVALCLVLDRAAPVGHTLWLTMSGYFVGMYLADIHVALRKSSIVLAMAGLLFVFVVFNALQIKAANGFFLVSISVVFFILTMHAAFHETRMNILASLDGSVLEIFMVHIYLFFYPTQIFGLDFVASLAVILGVAAALARVSKRLARVGAG